MRVLVLGAGAVGGYFGGRLLEAGVDVTFLVREGRAEPLRKNGLVIRSPNGNATLESPAIVTARDTSQFDLVILSSKAYDLESAIEAITPAVGPATVVLPLLNGLRHMDALDTRFGSDRVIGGFCAIAVTLTPDGTIVHLNRLHELRFGERGGGMTERIIAIERLMAPCGRGSFRLFSISATACRSSPWTGKPTWRGAAPACWISARCCGKTAGRLSAKTSGKARTRSNPCAPARRLTHHSAPRKWPRLRNTASARTGSSSDRRY